MFQSRKEKNNKFWDDHEKKKLLTHLIFSSYLFCGPCSIFCVIFLLLSVVMFRGYVTGRLQYKKYNTVGYSLFGNIEIKKKMLLATAIMT